MKGQDKMNKQSNKKNNNDLKNQQIEREKNKASNQTNNNSLCEKCKNASREGIGDGDPHGYSKRKKQ